MGHLSRIAVLFLLTSSSTLFAQKVFEEMSVEEMRSLLREAKYEFKETEEDQARLFDFDLDGTESTLYFFGKSMMLQTSFSDVIAVQAVNQWNRTERFTRAYINDNGNPFLESDLDFTGGVTEKTVTEFILAFSGSIGAYADFLSDADGEEIPLSTEVHKRSDEARTHVPAPSGNFAVWLDDRVWKRKSPGEQENRIELSHTNGQAFGAIIGEPLQFPQDALVNVALTNARAQDPDAQVTKQERRMVNGQEVLMIEMDATINKTPFHFYGYYYSDESGTVQVVTWTTRVAFERNRAVFTELLDGLEIKE